MVETLCNGIKEIMQLQIGDVCLCSRGRLGMITRNWKIPVTYSDGSSEMAWTGIHLEQTDDAEIGDAWSSRNPTLVTKASELRGMLGLHPSQGN